MLEIIYAPTVKEFHKQVEESKAMHREMLAKAKAK